jgi:hypothetical protein
VPHVRKHATFPTVSVAPKVHSRAGESWPLSSKASELCRSLGFAAKQATTNDPDRYDFGWRSGAGQTGDDQAIDDAPSSLKRSSRLRSARSLADSCGGFLARGIGIG